MIERHEPTLFVISGTQGAGKSTVARLLAGASSAAPGSAPTLLQKMIVSGGRWPEGAAMSGDAERQLRLRLVHACLLGRSFVAAGITAVVDDIVIGSRLDELLDALAGERFVFVMLTPRLDVIRERERERRTALWKQWEWLDEEIRTKTRRLGLWLDSSDQTPDETVDTILARAWTEGLSTPHPAREAGCPSDIRCTDSEQRHVLHVAINIVKQEVDVAYSQPCRWTMIHMEVRRASSGFAMRASSERFRHSHQD